MLIKVKTLTGKEIEIDIEPTDKVERIKERVEEKEGIPPPQQRLIFSGKQMNDEKTAADYKVQGGSVLHLVLALRGGFQMSYRLYRNTTLGHTLQEALDELMQMQMLSANLAIRVLLQVSFLSRIQGVQALDALYLTISHSQKPLRHYHHIAQSILPLQFDRSINSALSNRVRQKVNFKAEILNTYRFCDNVWTLMLNNVEFRDLPELTRVERVKIVACDAKSASLPSSSEDN